MSLVWFHRPHDSGIFVWFDSPNEAYNYARKILVDSSRTYPRFSSNWDSQLFETSGIITIGSTESLQVSLVSSDYTPAMGWKYWNNNREFIWCEKEEALKLLDDGNYIKKIEAVTQTDPTTNIGFLGNLLSKIGI